jgi:hypothetical protein
LVERGMSRKGLPKDFAGLGMVDPDVKHDLDMANKLLWAAWWEDIRVLFNWAPAAVINAACFCLCCCCTDMTHFNQKLVTGETHTVSTGWSHCTASNLQMQGDAARLHTLSDSL